MKSGHLIDYKALRNLNPSQAQGRLLWQRERLWWSPSTEGSSNRGNVSDTARVFGIQRAVLQLKDDILKKQQEGDLADRGKAPQRSPRRTPLRVEDKVIELKNQTRLGPKRLSIHLKRYYGQ